MPAGSTGRRPPSSPTGWTRTGRRSASSSWTIATRKAFAARTPQYAAGAELLWALSLRWSIPLDADHVVGHRAIDATQTCPGNLDIERLLREAAALDSEA